MRSTVDAGGGRSTLAFAGISAAFQRQHHQEMKTTTILLGCLFTFTLTAAEPSKPAAFEVRLVLNRASPDSEELTFMHQGTGPGKEVEEKLHVQKKPLLDRSAIESAGVARNRVTADCEVAIRLTQRGSKRLAEVTREHIGRRLAIVVDGKVYSAPTVNVELTGPLLTFSGSFSDLEAFQLAARLRGEAKK